MTHYCLLSVSICTFVLTPHGKTSKRSTGDCHAKMPSYPVYHTSFSIVIMIVSQVLEITSSTDAMRCCSSVNSTPTTPVRTLSCCCCYYLYCLSSCSCAFTSTCCGGERIGTMSWLCFFDCVSVPCRRTGKSRLHPQHPERIHDEHSTHTLLKREYVLIHIIYSLHLDNRTITVVRYRGYRR